MLDEEGEARTAHLARGGGTPEVDAEAEGEGLQGVASEDLGVLMWTEEGEG